MTAEVTNTRFIGSVPKYASISGYMRDTLHWLPIRQRIFYRVAVLALSYRLCPSLLAGTLSLCVDPGWASSASFLFWWQTPSSPCKHLDYAASYILSCCSFYLEFTSGPSIKYVTLFLANFDPPPP